MFLDEPEGKSFEELQQFLGSASALGTAIVIKTARGDVIDTFVYYSQGSLPHAIELFHPKEPVGEEVFTVPTSEIIWFNLKRGERAPAYINEHGIPTAVMPLVAIAAREIGGGGTIKNLGVTSVHADIIRNGGIKIVGHDEKTK